MTGTLRSGVQQPSAFCSRIPFVDCGVSGAYVVIPVHLKGGGGLNVTLVGDLALFCRQFCEEAKMFALI